VKHKATWLGVKVTENGTRISLNNDTWKCDGKTVGHDGHPAVYLPVNQKCPYCGKEQKDANSL